MYGSRQPLVRIQDWNQLFALMSLVPSDAMVHVTGKETCTELALPTNSAAWYSVSFLCVGCLALGMLLGYCLSKCAGQGSPPADVPVAYPAVPLIQHAVYTPADSERVQHRPEHRRRVHAATQSPATYLFYRARPEFRALPERQHGCWMEEW